MHLQDGAYFTNTDSYVSLSTAALIMVVYFVHGSVSLVAYYIYI